MLLHEQNTTKKEQVNKNMTKFEVGKSKKYKVKAIRDNTVYTNKTQGYLPGLYYLVV